MPPSGGPGTPEAPAVVSASPVAGGVSLAFTPAGDGGSPIVRFDAICDSDGHRGSATGSPVVVLGLPAGVMVGCRVQAVNANGPGLLSQTSFIAPLPPSNTRLLIHSQPGDTVGNGQSADLVPAAGDLFKFWLSNGYLQIRAISNTQPAITWNAGFRGRNGEALAVGAYPGAERYAVATPGLDINRDYRSCSNIIGRFDVHDLVHDAGGNVVSAAIDFEQRCEGDAARLFGQLRYNSAVAVDTARRIINPVTFPPVTNATPGSVVTSSSQVLNGINVPVTISITDGEYSINNGPFISGPSTIINNTQVRVRVTAPDSANTLATAILRVGSVDLPFHVGTAPGVAPQPTAGAAMISLIGQPKSIYGSLQRAVISPATLAQLRVVAENGYGWDKGFQIETTNLSGNGSVTGWLRATGPANTQLQPGIYEDAGTLLSPGKAGFAWSSQDAPDCDYVGDSTARVVVHEVEYDANNLPTRLALDFVHACSLSGYTNSRVYGFVRLASTVPIDYSLRLPVPFSFPAVTGASLSTPYISATGTVSGINVPIAISVTGGEYSLDNGPFTSAAGSVTNGQNVRLRVTSGASPNTLTRAVLNLGGFTTEFRVGTATGAAPQPTTDPLVVVVTHPRHKYGVVTRAIHSPATGAGISFLTGHSNGVSTVNVTAASGDFSFQFSGPGTSPIGAGDYPDAVGDAYHDTKASVSYGYAHNCYPYSPAPVHLTVHEATYDTDGKPVSLAADFVAQCNGGDSARLYGYVRLNSVVPIDYAIRRPAPFGFAAVAGAAPSTVVTSTAEIIRGITEAVPISVTGGEYSIDSGPFTASPGTISDGQQVRVRLTSASTPNQVTSASLVVGEETVAFRVGTSPGADPQPDGSPMIVIRGQRRSDGELYDRILSAGTLFDVTLRPRDYWGAQSIFRAVPSIDSTFNDGWIGYAGGANASALAVGSYLDPGESNNGALPSFTVNSYIEGVPRCYYSDSPTSYTVHEVEHAVNGDTLRLALDFIMTCTDSYGIWGAVHGYVRIGSNVPIDYAVRRPLPLVFPAVTGVQPGSVVTSEEVILRGINVAIPVSVDGGEYSLDGGPFTSAAGTATAGQRIRLRATAAAQPNRLTSVQFTAGDIVSTFQIGTDPGADPQPAGAFLAVFASQGNDPVGLGRTQVVSPATLATLSSATLSYGSVNLTFSLPPVPPSTWPRNFSVSLRGPNGAVLVPGTYPGATRNSYATPGQTVFDAQLDGYCWERTASEYVVHEIETSGSAVTRLAVDFVQTCGSFQPLLGYVRLNSVVPIVQAPDLIPSPFSFASVSGVPRATPVVSAPTVLAGFSVAAPISITNGEYSLDGGAFTSAAGTVLPGQAVRVRLTSHPSFGGSTRATVTVAGVTANFDAYSEYVDSYPDPITFPTVRGVADATWIPSAVITPTGFNIPVNISITNGEMSLDGRPFTTQGGVLVPGETLQLRVLSGSGAGVTRTTYAYINGMYVTFSAVTLTSYPLTVSVLGQGTVSATNAPLTCPGNCGTTLPEGSTVTLVANPGSGKLFAGWQGGGCSGTAGCTVTLDQATTVTATFTDGLPGAPMLTAAVPGDARATLAFQAPAGGATSYTATCQPGNVTASGSTSPISVTGLANGTEYTCRVRATTAQGAGPDSNALTVTPAAAAPLAVVAAVSRKTHAGVGDLDIPLNAAPATGAITVDPRWSANGHLIVFQMNAAVTAVGAVTLVDHLGAAVGNASVTFNGNDVLVSLIGVPDARRLTVSVAGVNGTLPVSASLGVLVGDVNGSGTVDASDTAALRGQAGQAVRADNAGFDVNASGGISAGDVATVKARAGRSLP